MFEWLKEVDSLSLCNVQLNLKKSYNNFFSKRSKFPRFKNKKDSKQSYTTNNVNNSIRIENGKLKLPKLGLMETIFHRRIEGDIKSVTITKTASNKYYVSILSEQDFQHITNPNKSTVLGMDYSMNHFVVTSEGEKTNPPNWYYDMEKKISKLNKRLHRKVKGSNNRNKAKQKLVTVYEEMTSKKKDFLHKLSYKFLKNNDAIVLEDIDLTREKEKEHWGKKVSSLGFGMFRTMLEYKAISFGKEVVKADKYFPSTQLCSHCGFQNKLLKNNLKVRHWKCPICLKEHDRDINAAINLKQSYTGASPGIHVWGNRTSTNGTVLLTSLVVEPEKVVSPLMAQALSFR